MAMMTTDTLRTLAGKHAWDPSVLVDLGLPADLVMKMVAAGPRATPERPRLSLAVRKRRGAPTTLYIWGPDIPAYLD